MFRKRSFPRVVMNPQDANREFIRGNVELVRLSEAEGRVAAEGRCPIRRGIMRGARRDLGRGSTALFPRAGGGVNMLPGFSPELQGFTARRIRMVLSGCMATC